MAKFDISYEGIDANIGVLELCFDKLEELAIDLNHEIAVEELAIKRAQAKFVKEKQAKGIDAIVVGVNEHTTCDIWKMQRASSFIRELLVCVQRDTEVISDLITALQKTQHALEYTNVRKFTKQWMETHKDTE